MVVFKTKVLHFKIENTPIKDTNGKRKFKRMLSFLFVDKRKLFAMKLSFEEFNLVFYRANGTLGLACFEPTKAPRFLKTLEVHSVLHDQRKVRFFKMNFCLYKYFMDVFYILTSA